MLDMANHSEDAPAILEARCARPGDEVVATQGLRPVHQRGRLPRISHKRSDDHAQARRYAIMRGISWPQRSTRRPAKPSLYHEPQIVYALDPEIAAGAKEARAKLSTTPDTPTVIAGYCGSKDAVPQAKASVPTGVLIRDTTMARSTVREFPAGADASRDRDHEGRAPAGQDRATRFRTDRQAVRERSSRLGNFPTESIPSSARTWGRICSTPPSSTARRGP